MNIMHKAVAHHHLPEYCECQIIELHNRIAELEAEVELLKLRVEKLDSRSEHRRRLNNNLEQDNADLTKRIEELEAAMTNGNLMVMKCDECKKLQVVTIKWGQRNRRCPVCI